MTLFSLALSRRSLTACSLLAAAALMGPKCAAQDAVAYLAPETPIAVMTAEEFEALMTDEVSVTDTIRRTEDRAEAIDIIPLQDVETIVHPAEALNAQAGVNIHRGSGQEHLTAIRSPVLTGGAGAGSFLYLENGVPLRAAGFANVNGLFEAGTEFARQVEVFKGPGPVEYGSNAVHGLINVDTARPGDGGRVTLIGSSRGYGRLTAAVDVTDQFRASLSLAHDDGFRDDSGFDQQKAELRYVDDLGTWSVDWRAAVTNLNQETAGFLQEGPDAYLDRELIEINAFPEAFRDGRHYRTSAAFSKEMTAGRLTLTPYARRAELRFLRHFVPGQALEKNGHTSVGLQSELIGEDWSVGVDAEYTDGFLYEFQENSTALGFLPVERQFTEGLHFDYEVEAIVLAVYVQKSWRASERLRLDFGARGEYTRYDYDTQAAPGRSGRFIRSPDRKDDFFTLTPKLSLFYQAGNNTALFARAARGSRAPQTTDLYAVVQNQRPGEADVETLDSLEAGVRFGRRASVMPTPWLELTAYTMWKDNFFFRNAAGFNVVDGKTRHSGLEASFGVPVNDWLSFSGEWSAASHLYNFDDPASGIFAGNQVDTAPVTLGTFRAQAVWDELDAALEWRHVGPYFTNGANTRRYAGHDIFIARGGYFVTDAIRLFGRVDNLFDTRYADRADFAFGNDRYFPGRPRTLFLGLTADF